MALSKYGLKALGLCALVLGLMALSAGAAQAEATAHWNVGGSNINGTGLKPELQVKEIEELRGPEPGKHLVLLTKILGNLYHILCTGATLVGFILLDNGGSSGKIKFTGCKAIVAGVVQAKCEPKSGGVAGVIETVALKDLIVLHDLGGGVVDTLDRLEPNAGETFTVVESSATCAVGEKIPVKGKFFIKDCQNEFQTEKTDHLIEEGPLTHLFVISDTVEHAAQIHGSVLLKLVGATHAGLKWSGTPA